MRFKTVHQEKSPLTQQKFLSALKAKFIFSNFSSPMYHYTITVPAEKENLFFQNKALPQVHRETSNTGRRLTTDLINTNPSTFCTASLHTCICLAFRYRLYLLCPHVARRLDSPNVVQGPAWMDIVNEQVGHPIIQFW